MASAPSARPFPSAQLLCWLLLCPLAGCGETDVSQLVGPEGVRCLAEITGVPTSVAATASQATGVVATERECSWTATSSASWLVVSPGAGQGETTVMLAIAANSTSNTRAATLIVNGNPRVTVTQAAGSSPPPTQPPSTSVAFSGSVSNLIVIGGCPVLAFSVAGRQVVTDANTRFTGGNCTSVRNGRSVEIEGEQVSADLVRATRVRQ